MYCAYKSHYIEIQYISDVLAPDPILNARLYDINTTLQAVNTEG